MSAKTRVNGASASPSYRSEEAGTVPLASGGDGRTTSDLTQILMDQLDGVLADEVPLAKASTVARLSGAVLKSVQLECVYGPQQMRRKALPLSSCER